MMEYWITFKKKMRGQPRGRVVKFTCSASVAQGFSSLDARHRPKHRSSSHAEAMSHMAQPEGSTTRIYNYVLGGFGEKKKKGGKKEDWQQVLAQLPVF